MAEDKNPIKSPVVKCPQSYQWDLEDVSKADAGRTEDGTMEKGRIGQVVKISTGVAVALPAYCFGGLYARSGLASKKGLRPANCVGVIDEDYRGCILVAIRNDSNEVQVIQHGERIAQLIVQPYIPIVFNEVNELPETIRGAGGFGSTGAM